VKKIGKYEVILTLGTGGAGVVYKAKDTLSGDIVAIKTFSPPDEITADTVEKLYARFKQEIGFTKKFQHKNIVSYIEDFIFEKKHHLVIEYIETIEKNHDEKWSLSSVLSILIQLASALDYAHNLKIIHRDIKPENILIGGTIEKPICILADFGIAYQDEENIRMTNTGEIIGTFFYMSPEQIESRECTSKTDIYALGLFGYELMTGERVYNEVSPARVIGQVMQSSPQPPSRLRSDIPPSLDRIILRCLRRDENARYQSAKDLLMELEALQAIGFDESATKQFLLAVQFVPLVGRDHELSSLTHTLSEIRDGTSRYTYLIGPTGIGKTRLLSELTSVARAWRMKYISIQVTRNDAKVPFGVIAKIAEVLLGDYLPKHKWVRLGLASLSSVLSKRMSEKPPELGARELSHLIEDAFIWLVKDFCRVNPLLIAIDDSQWADAGSSHLAQNIMRFLDGIGLFVVFAINTDMVAPNFGALKMVEETRAGTEIINLTPLKDNDVLLCAKLTLGVRKIPSTLLDFIVKESGGNPLYIIELLRTLIRKGEIKLDEDSTLVLGNEFSIPNKLIRYQNLPLSNLDDSTGNLLRIAAVIGPTFSSELLASVSGSQLLDVHSHLDNALSNQVLRVVTTSRGNVYSFAHEQMRKNIENSTSKHFRQGISQKTASAIEKLFSANLDEYLESLIHHYTQSVAPTKAIPYLIRAGKISAERFQHDEARVQTNRALVLAKNNNLVEYSIIALELLSDISFASGRSTDALSQIQEALDLSDGFPEITSGYKARLLRLCAARNKNATGKLEVSLRLINRAMEYLSGTVNFGEISKAELMLAECLSDANEALVHARRALQVAEETNDNVMVINCLGTVAKAMRTLGKPEESIVLLKRACDIGEKNGLEVALEGIYASLAGIMFNEIGDSSAGEEYAKKAKILARRTNNLTLIAFFDMVEGANAFQNGLMRKAEKLYLEAIEIWEKIGQNPRLYSSLMMAGWVYHEIENYKKSNDCLIRSKKLSYEISQNAIDIDLISLEIELMAQRNDFESMITLIKQTVDNKGGKENLEKRITFYYSVAKVYLENNEIIEAWNVAKEIAKIQKKTYNPHSKSDALLICARVLTQIVTECKSKNYFSKMMILSGTGLLGKDIIKITESAFDDAFIFILKNGLPVKVIMYYLEHCRFLRVKAKYEPADRRELERTIAKEINMAYDLLKEIDHPRLEKEVIEELARLSEDKEQG